MNTPKAIFRLIAAWIALLAAQVVAGMMVHVNSPSMPNVLLWMGVSNAVVVLALGIAALRSDWRDWRLLLALFLVPAAIDIVNSIEGVVYLPNLGIDWRGIIIFELLARAVTAVLWLLIFRSAPVPAATNGAPLPHRSFSQNLGRFVLCSACYVFLYFLAGTIVFPHVRDFYATQRIPSPGQIIALQFFLRGPVFILVCLTLLRMFRLPHLAGALAVGLSFTFLSGVAALIIPNPYFPDYVRWAHFCEVTSSNFVFGFVVGWVWGHSQWVSHPATVLA
jgi:hypothetical protein